MLPGTIWMSEPQRLLYVIWGQSKVMSVLVIGNLTGDCGGLPGSRSRALLESLVLCAYQKSLDMGHT